MLGSHCESEYTKVFPKHNVHVPWVKAIIKWRQGDCQETYINNKGAAAYDNNVLFFFTKKYFMDWRNKLNFWVTKVVLEANETAHHPKKKTPHLWWSMVVQASSL